MPTQNVRGPGRVPGTFGHNNRTSPLKKSDKIQTKSGDLWQKSLKMCVKNWSFFSVVWPTSLRCTKAYRPPHRAKITEIRVKQLPPFPLPYANARGPDFFFNQFCHNKCCGLPRPPLDAKKTYRPAHRALKFAPEIPLYANVRGPERAPGTGAWVAFGAQGTGRGSRAEPKGAFAGRSVWSLTNENGIDAHAFGFGRNRLIKIIEKTSFYPQTYLTLLSMIIWNNMTSLGVGKNSGSRWQLRSGNYDFKFNLNKSLGESQSSNNNWGKNMRPGSV